MPDTHRIIRAKDRKLRNARLQHVIRSNHEHRDATRVRKWDRVMPDRVDSRAEGRGENIEPMRSAMLGRKCDRAEIRCVMIE